MEDKVRALEGDREKLITDNVSLIKSIDRIKEENAQIKQGYEEAKRGFEEKLAQAARGNRL